MGVATDSPYGYCPFCGGNGATRERRPNGDDTCVNGHKYPSAKALKDPTAAAEIAAIYGARKESSKAAAVELKTMLLQPSVHDTVGPLAVCVTGHQKAEEVADLLCALRGPYDQGVVVIPYAASAFNYVGRGTKHFRGLLIIPPRPGQQIDRGSFDRWIEMSVMPYAAPNASKVIL